MDHRIKSLPAATFYGKRLTRKQIAMMQQTVEMFPNLSRTELARTICEHMGWQKKGGIDRLALCLRILEALQREGIFTLPAKREQARKRIQSKPKRRAGTEPPEAVVASLAQLGGLKVAPVVDADEALQWNEWLDRHHYLGYARPRGEHLRYCILDGAQRKLGCLLFEPAMRQVRCRDEWIGWRQQQFKKHLPRVVNNSRFLIFPWVRVDNLASKALSLALQRLPGDWHQAHGTRPALVETFVDPSRYSGASCKAANWQLIGRTRGGRKTADGQRGGPKDVYVYELCEGHLDHGTPPSAGATRYGA